MSRRDVEIENAFRRSVASIRMILALHVLREARTSQLARAAGIPPQRVAWIFRGELPYYRKDQSHKHLGLVTRRGTKGRYVYAITDLGDDAVERLLDPRWRQG